MNLFYIIFLVSSFSLLASGNFLKNKLKKNFPFLRPADQSDSQNIYIPDEENRQISHLDETTSNSIRKLNTRNLIYNPEKVQKAFIYVPSSRNLNSFKTNSQNPFVLLKLVQSPNYEFYSKPSYIQNEQYQIKKTIDEDNFNDQTYFTQNGLSHQNSNQILNRFYPENNFSIRKYDIPPNVQPQNDLQPNNQQQNDQQSNDQQLNEQHQNEQPPISQQSPNRPRYYIKSKCKKNQIIQTENQIRPQYEKTFQNSFNDFSRTPTKQIKQIFYFTPTSSHVKQYSTTPPSPPLRDSEYEQKTESFIQIKEDQNDFSIENVE